MYPWKDIFRCRKAEDIQSYGEVLASVFDRYISLEDDLCSMRLSGINDMSQDVFNVLGYFYNIPNCNLAVHVTRNHSLFCALWST